MFIDLTGKKVLVVGGGSIALRRVQTLLRFRADIRVIAPQLCGGLSELEHNGMIRAEHRKYCEGDVAEKYRDGGKKREEVSGPSPGGTETAPEFVLAATDSREVNRIVWQECRNAGIPVNVADDKNLCDFFFPSVVMTDEIVVGINSGGTDPGKVKAARKKIEQFLRKDV